jgi:hypothetical protein
MALLDALRFEVTPLAMGHGAHAANRLLIARPAGTSGVVV